MNIFLGDFSYQRMMKFLIAEEKKRRRILERPFYCVRGSERELKS
jgi:hypothetical protein